MDSKTRDLLARVLDMEELELRATLIAVVNGIPIEEAIDEAYNSIKRQARKLQRGQT
jgi:hypothetical protein